MFWKISVFSLALILSSVSQAVPKIEKVSVEKSYVPIGFDDNDRAQITVAGVFPATCYKVGEVGTTINERDKTIHIWQTAYRYGGTCVPIIVPFVQVVNLGVIGQGDYRLFDGPSGKFIGKLPVAKATKDEADDFLYAPINDAFLIVDADGTKTLTLLGEFTDRCTQFEEVKVSYHGEVIVVLPIARHIAGGRCAPIKTRFMKTVELDPSLHGTYLLHVRSMSGQAINKLVEAQFME